MTRRQSVPATFLWLWVAAIAGAYLWQFSDLVDPILEALSSG